MNYRILFFTLCLIIIVCGAFYAEQEYQKSGQHIDATFSNRTADNKQLPANLEGSCFGETDLLSASVIRETPSSLLLYITYCNNLVSDKAVLGIGSDHIPGVQWINTPGGTVHGYGYGYARLFLSDLEKPITVSDYKISIYGNNSGANIVSYKFHHEKVWCVGDECNTL